MNVLHVNKFHYPRAGPEQVYLETARLLEKQGHKSLFFSMHHPENLPCDTAKFFVPYVELNASHSILNQIKIAGRILYYLKARKNLSMLLDRYHIDIAHLHDICYHISPSILHELKKRKIPVVMTLHDFKMVCTSYYMFANGKICESCSGGKYYMAIVKRCVKDSFPKSVIAALEMYLHHKIIDIYNNVDIFISPSLFLKKKLKEAGFNKKIIHLYNFFDIHKCTKYDNFNEKKNNVITYIGRISQEKGLFTLLNAAKFLIKRGRKVQINIIGDGILKKELCEKAKVQQINNVNFLGYMKHDDLIQEIKKSLVIVLPSEWYENNPMSVIEAFAFGTPVIGSRIGGICELVKDYERGLTFDSGNPEDLALKIEFFLDNPHKAKEMGENAKIFVEQELSAERYYHGLMKIYKEAINSSKIKK